MDFLQLWFKTELITITIQSVYLVLKRSNYTTSTEPTRKCNLRTQASFLKTLFASPRLWDLKPVTTKPNPSLKVGSQRQYAPKLRDLRISRFSSPAKTAHPFLTVFLKNLLKELGPCYHRKKKRWKRTEIVLMWPGIQRLCQPKIARKEKENHSWKCAMTLIEPTTLLLEVWNPLYQVMPDQELWTGLRPSSCKWTCLEEVQMFKTYSLEVQIMRQIWLGRQERDWNSIRRTS